MIIPNCMNEEKYYRTLGMFLMREDYNKVIGSIKLILHDRPPLKCLHSSTTSGSLHDVAKLFQLTLNCERHNL